MSNEIDKELYEKFGRDVYRNKYDNDGDNAKTGYEAEDAFFLACQHYDEYSDISPATEDENVLEHIDFKAKKFGSVDVKSKKEAFDQGQIWIEHTNVVGEKGWLYGGARYIAFDWGDHFRMVPLEWLQITVNKLTKNAKEVKHKNAALYNWYQRKGRKDWLTKVTAEDIFFITDLCISKYIINQEEE